MQHHQVIPTDDAAAQSVTASAVEIANATTVRLNVGDGEEKTITAITTILAPEPHPSTESRGCGDDSESSDGDDDDDDGGGAESDSDDCENIIDGYDANETMSAINSLLDSQAPLSMPMQTELNAIINDLTTIAATVTVTTDAVTTIAAGAAATTDATIENFDVELERHRSKRIREYTLSVAKRNNVCGTYVTMSSNARLVTIARFNSKFTIYINAKIHKNNKFRELDVLWEGNVSNQSREAAATECFACNVLIHWDTREFYILSFTGATHCRQLLMRILRKDMRLQITTSNDVSIENLNDSFLSNETSVSRQRRDVIFTTPIASEYYRVKRHIIAAFTSCNVYKKHDGKWYYLLYAMHNGEHVPVGEVEKTDLTPIDDYLNHYKVKTYDEDAVYCLRPYLSLRVQYNDFDIGTKTLTSPTYIGRAKSSDTILLDRLNK